MTISISCLILEIIGRSDLSAINNLASHRSFHGAQTAGSLEP
jgi:hypothetical protein